MLSFKLDPSFTQQYEGRNPNFGFNGLGLLVYQRTYSRVKSDNAQERWHETCERVINGMYSILKDYAIRHGREWSDSKAQRSAQDAFDRMFDLKWSPPGRGLWMMGTPFVHERRIPDALQNCAFVSTENIDINAADPFVWAMNRLMLGVGVGFDTRGTGKCTIQIPHGNNNKEIFIVPDTREGWADGLGKIITAFTEPGNPIPTFDFSRVRQRGEPIKGFGGVSSGPEPLKKLYSDVIEVLSRNHNKPFTSRIITDIFNMIGTCVVAGNVRRSAEIALGLPEDEEFLNLKNYDMYPERADFGWSSNNTVISRKGMDYSGIAQRIFSNGEPGLIWFDNIHANGRMNGEPAQPDMSIGINPCGEQPLYHKEMCTLVETFPTRHDGIYDYLRSLKYAYLYGKAVTLMSEEVGDPESRKVMMQNRRIGTSMTGVVQLIQSKGADYTRTLMDAGYQEIQRYDRVYSMWLDVPRSIRTTSIKPSGTVSLLAGVTPGIHFPHSEYYIRRVKVSSDSTLCEQFKSMGYHTEPDAVSANTTVIEFPVHAGDNIPSVSSVSIWQQLSVAAMAQKYWSDNSVSATITFDPGISPDELSNAIAMYEDQLKAISFLPNIEGGAYKQMPYESITKEQYEEMLSRITKARSIIVSPEDMMEDKYCDGEACEIQF